MQLRRFQESEKGARVPAETICCMTYAGMIRCLDDGRVLYPYPLVQALLSLPFVHDPLSIPSQPGFRSVAKSVTRVTILFEEQRSGENLRGVT